jgi:hypothetical protein
MSEGFLKIGQVYFYGFPLVLMDITRLKGIVNVAQMNRFYNQKVVSTPQFNEVTRSNVYML